MDHPSGTTALRVDPPKDDHPRVEHLKIRIEFRRIEDLMSNGVLEEKKPSHISSSRPSQPILEEGNNTPCPVQINYSPLRFWFNNDNRLSLPWIAIPWTGPHPDDMVEDLDVAFAFMYHLHHEG